MTETNSSSPPVSHFSNHELPSLRRIWFWTLGLVAFLALCMSVLLWQKVGVMQEQLARQNNDSLNQSLEARLLAKQAMALAQESSGRIAVIDARLAEVALQRSQLEELIQTLTRSRDENLAVDVDAALRLAQQQAQWTGSVEPLLSALQTAQQRLKRSALPRMTVLLHAITHDIERIKSTTVSDTPTLLARLDELVRLSDELVLANAVGPRSQTAHAPASAPQEAVWWKRALATMTHEMRALVRVSSIQDPESVLLTPDQSFFVHENLKLKLLNVRLCLLSRQIQAAQADLGAAESALKKYFDLHARKTQMAMDLVRQVQNQMRYLQLPAIDDTLAILATLSAGR